MNSPVLNIVVASRDIDVQHRTKSIFDRDNFVIHDAADVLDITPLDSVVTRLSMLDPHVIMLGPELGTEMALALVELLGKARPDTSVVLVAQPNAELFHSALRAGATDVLAPDADDSSWAFAIERAIATTSRIRGITATVPEPSPQAKAQVVTILSPKGGSGKTTVASNMAVTLAKHQPGEVVLVDLDLQFGDVAHALRIAPEYTLAEATSASMETTALKAFLTHRDPLYALCAPEQPEQADDIAAESVGIVLDQLASTFQTLILDTPAGLDDVTLAAIDRSTDLVFISSTDVPSVRAVQKELEILDRMGIVGPKRHLVMNRSDAKVGLDSKDIAITTGLAIEASVPSSRQIPIAMNRGIPLTELEPRSPAAKSIAGFAELLAGIEPTSKGLFRGGRR